MKLNRLLLAVAVTYTATIVYYSLVAEEELEPLPIGELYKLKGGFYVHLLAYLGLAILWRGAGSKMTTSFMLAVAVGGALEVAQFFIPFRSASMMDFLANSLGGFVGAAVVPMISKKFYM